MCGETSICVGNTVVCVKNAVEVTGSSALMHVLCGEFEAIASLHPIEVTPRTLSPSESNSQRESP